MDFSREALNRVRAAIEEYRFTYPLNGRRRTWFRVAEELFDEHLSHLPLDPDSDVIVALAEALRQFAAGTQVLTDERREALSKFLIGKRMLTSDDLVAGPGIAGLVKSLREFFAIDPDIDAAVAQVFAGTYYATRRAPNNRAHASILTIASSPDGHISVDERVHALPSLPPLQSAEGIRRYSATAGASISRYEGILLGTRQGHICVFVRNNALPSAGVYTLLRHKGDLVDNKPSDYLLVLKSNDFGTAQRRGGASGIKVVETSAERLSIADVIAGNAWEYIRQETR